MLDLLHKPRYNLGFRIYVTVRYVLRCVIKRVSRIYSTGTGVRTLLYKNDRDLWFRTYVPPPLLSVSIQFTEFTVIYRFLSIPRVFPSSSESYTPNPTGNWGESLRVIIQVSTLCRNLQPRQVPSVSLKRSQYLSNLSFSRLYPSVPVLPLVPFFGIYSKKRQNNDENKIDFLKYGNRTFQKVTRRRDPVLDSIILSVGNALV